MKSGIHPAYFPHAKTKCACGAVFEIGATKETLETEICSKCHPLYTGKAKLIDAAGRVEKFKKKVEKQKAAQKGKK